MKKRGFTIIEMIIVIAIIGIISAIAAPSVITYRNNSNLQSAVAGANSVYTAAVMYSTYNDFEPDATNNTIDIITSENLAPYLDSNYVIVPYTTDRANITNSNEFSVIETAPGTNQLNSAGNITLHKNKTFQVWYYDATVSAPKCIVFEDETV